MPSVPSPDPGEAVPYQARTSGFADNQHYVISAMEDGERRWRGVRLNPVPPPTLEGIP